MGKYVPRRPGSKAILDHRHEAVVAMVLPWTLNRLGRDPAFGSGPLATVVQDLLSLVVYVLVASAIVT